MDNNEVISWFGGEFYYDFHIRRLRQLPLDRFFAEYKDRPGLRILEVGCCEGQSTLWWLKMYLNGDNSSITCIDPYMAKWYDDPLNEIRLPTTKSTFEVFKSNILDKYDKDKVIFYKNNSAQVLPSLKGPYDIIYIDGDHSYEGVKNDLQQSYYKIKNGGYQYNLITEINSKEEMISKYNPTVLHFKNSQGNERWNKKTETK